MNPEEPSLRDAVHRLATEWFRILGITAFQLLLPGIVVFASDMPSGFRLKIAYQTSEEWRLCVMSSHADRVEDARPDSKMIGSRPLSIATKIARILVSVPQPEKAGTRLKEEAIYAAISDYIISAPAKATSSFDPATDRWIEVTESQGQKYRIILLNGVPSELYIRRDANTLIRFGLEKKIASKR